MQSIRAGRLFGILCGCLATSAFAVTTLTRGPYLQNLSPTSVVIRWRSSAADDTLVHWGTAPASLTFSTSSGASTTEHSVLISSLDPASTYYYDIGSTTLTLAGGDANHTFTTLPTVGSTGTIRMWALGDFGTGDSQEGQVRDGFETWNAGRPIQGWLFLGDNAYFSGTDAEYQTGVFVPMQNQLRKWCAYPAPGNHDAVSANSVTQTGPYFENFTMPAGTETGAYASGTAAYYSFNVGNAHFISLDSADSDLDTGGSMFTWLRADLADTAQTWIIAYWHHPPYTKGTHNSDNSSDSENRMGIMRSIALPILENAGADLVLCGHSHVYERSYLLNGHYDVSSAFLSSMKIDGGSGQTSGSGAYHKANAVKYPNNGTVYVVSGGGSAGLAANPPLNHPAHYAGINTYESVGIEISDKRLDLYCIGTSGQVLDNFTILKDLVVPVTISGFIAE